MRNTSVLPPQLTYTHPTADAREMPRGTRPYLPIDMPLRESHFPAQTVVGLGFWASLAARFRVPYPVTPFNWPKGTTSPSQAGPAAAGGRLSSAVNTFSPVSHRATRAMMSTVIPQPILQYKYQGNGRQPNSGRPRGVVLPFPFAAPQWMSISGKVVD